MDGQNQRKLINTNLTPLSYDDENRLRGGFEVIPTSIVEENTKNKGADCENKNCSDSKNKGDSCSNENCGCECASL